MVGVVAAAAGTVAAITQDTAQTPIIVIRHDGGLLTVYAGVAGTTVKKGDKVITQGGIIGRVFKITDDEVTIDTGEGGKLRIVRSMIVDVKLGVLIGFMIRLVWPRRTGSVPRKLKLRFDRPPEIWTCGQRALISRVASMKSTP